MRNSSNLLKSLNTLTQTAQQINYEKSLTPMSNKLFQYKQNFLYECEINPFKDDSWKFNPQLYCLAVYEDPHLYPIILICNNLGSIYQFTSEKLKNGIKTPKKDRVYNILNTMI